MGAKITVDCATLMNKGLEVIEAMRLYHLPPEQVSVVIHRQSIIHSLVEYWDGAVLAQLGTPDMRLPIQLRPDLARSGRRRRRSRWICCPARRSTFAPPDLEAFPCLALAHGGGPDGRHRLRGAQRRQRGGGGPLPARRRSAFMTFPAWWSGRSVRLCR